MGLKAINVDFLNKGVEMRPGTYAAIRKYVQVN